LRKQIWQRLATDLYPKLLEKVAHRVPLKELQPVFPLMLQGKHRGRTVIEIIKIH
jgi:acrylyl-CoA reductase (NADPH)